MGAASPVEQMPGHHETVAAVVALSGHDHHLFPLNIRKPVKDFRDDGDAGIFHENRADQADFLHGLTVHVSHLLGI